MMHFDRDLKHMNGDQTHKCCGSHQHTTVRSRMHTHWLCYCCVWLRVWYWLRVLLAACITGCVYYWLRGRCVLLASHLPRERNVAMTDPVSKLQVWLINLVSDVIVQQRHLLD